MDKIHVMLLNDIEDSNFTEKMFSIAARLTQHGAKIKTADDFNKYFNEPMNENTIKSIASLPHQTLQKLTKINIAVIGASRRFLAQITRHQDGVKFISASCQYSDYSDDADFVVPYEIYGNDIETKLYLEACKDTMEDYKCLARNVGHDAAAYAMPQGLRNVLIISATPWEWKHMISQRICRRNSPETRYVMLKCWDMLISFYPNLFDINIGDTGCWCLIGDLACREGKMSCGIPITYRHPDNILREDFEKLYEE